MDRSEEPKRKMCVEEPIRVRTYDVDYMQIVSNTVYVRWFEDLRTAILDRYFPLTEMLKENNSPILTETNIRYRRPVTLQSKPVGRAWIEELRDARWVARVEIVEGPTVYCEGRQEGYYFNLERRRPERFPQSLLDLYEKL